MIKSRIALAAVALLAAAAFASADELKIYSTTGVQNGLEPLLPQLEKTTGMKVSVTWNTAAQLVKRIQAGERADVYIMTHQSYEVLVKENQIMSGTGSTFASSGMGVAVKKGAAKPDISTADKFKAAMLNAKSVAYSNPNGGGASGVYLAKLFERLGIADQMKAKAKFPPIGTATANLVVSGEAEIAVQQMPEIMAVSAIDVVGALPADLNNVTIYSAGVAVDTKHADAAKAAVKFLTAPSTQAAFKAKGVDPAPATAPAKAS